MKSKSTSGRTASFVLPVVLLTSCQANRSRRILCRFALFLQVLVMLVVQGCVIFPVPKRTIAGTEIEATRLEFIQPDVTSQARVLKELGPPDANFEDIRVIAYAWESSAALMIWITPALTTGTQILAKPNVLLIEFDERKHVRRFELTGRGQRDTIRSRAVAWAKAGTNSVALRLPNRFVPVSIPRDKSVIHVYRPRGFEVPFVAVSVILDRQPLADLRSKECVSVVLGPGSHSLTLRPHLLSSNTGSLDVVAVGRTICVDAMPNSANYLEVTIPVGRGRLDPNVEILPEQEAMPALAELKPW